MKKRFHKDEIIKPFANDVSSMGCMVPQQFCELCQRSINDKSDLCHHANLQMDEDIKFLYISCKRPSRPQMRHQTYH